MPTVVVTGANSGIGLAFAEILEREGWNVYTLDLAIGERLKSLKVKSFQLDVSSPKDIDSFGESFGEQPLDLLLNIAGIMPPKVNDSLATIDLATLSKVFSVNTFGPLLLTQRLLPNLLKSSSPRIGNMSSRVGSIADNSSGGSYSYRSSKSALNSISNAWRSS
ncbi:hypothetical protein JAAARDRAFT_354502 [Jaapia argillacea MUCL 33604]|uniref:Uncharacterized protein n=1 Tax=Jaapia argillacea MUCL 33604 TaxID=933084 RepID=A0A067PUJ7_9AGAM|nr:hypothetical protein JAAARDRAFT_354502 [Jaapia argillacea MUCL 33604]